MEAQQQSTGPDVLSSPVEPVPTSAPFTSSASTTATDGPTTRPAPSATTVTAQPTRPLVSPDESAYRLDELQCHDRLDRMVRVTLPPAGRPYQRSDLINHVQKTVGLQNLEAIGPTHRSNIFELTFSSVFQKLCFIGAGEFTVKGVHRATVSSMRTKRHYVKILWYADCMPMSRIVEYLNGSAIKS